MVIERHFKDLEKKYIFVDSQKVRQWLLYLFANHVDYIRLSKSNQLVFSEAAVQCLASQTELAEVLFDNEVSTEEPIADQAITQPAMESGLSSSEVYTLDKHNGLYVSAKNMLKIRRQGKIEILEDTSVRKISHSTSANLCFPSLYPNAEKSPLDFGDHKLAKKLLKKQSLYAHQMEDGCYKYLFAENSIHMMHNFARLQEQRVHCVLGYYLSQHPDCAVAPLDAVLASFKEGRQEDGLLDSKMPDLSAVMSEIPNTKEFWFSERLGIEAISRDKGSCNLFLTLNNDVRSWPDVRSLLHRLEHGEDSVMDPDYFEKNTEKHTELLNKFAVQISIYLHLKVKLFLKYFFCKICGIPEKNNEKDWSEQDQSSSSWYWARVEFTDTRFVCFLLVLKNK
jgi:hypothetical protein